MGEQVSVLIGTRKGVFIARSDAGRSAWQIDGPHCEAWPINHVIADDTGTLFAGGGNEWFGPAVWRSTDGGRSWNHFSAGLTYGEGGTPIKAVWSLARRGKTLYAGVEPAGLFRSEDEGETWSHVEGLQRHPSRPTWVPGAGGMILHSIVLHPDDPTQIWVAISAAGVFHTTDGGETWAARNSGTRCDFLPEGQQYPETGQCVHCLVMAPGRSNRLYQQNHCGMYRSDDGGVSWQSIEKGLPSTFGFPAAVHPRDPERLYLVPLNGAMEGRFVPDGRAAVWSTGDAGSSWHGNRAGLPQENAFFGVLRQAMATDCLEPAGVYFGTSSGELYASADEGTNWISIAAHLPVIHSVETWTPRS
ncbi:WD40/YVTN/BNR-like repeat-containing protein [Oryzibacter oryziterrae]|uniref:WD40/YVTN/BNR-like repeat-containing protein n=1 Tax=Oryzibacter oryziterrae TaxID=2766474 RepID=UPI001F36556D|nr:exo-alpha-sialidase [Oryzibacter oryziterrae]